MQEQVHDGGLRQLEKSYDYWTVTAAFVVSFLGTFTSTQLMIQARLTARFSSILTWMILISLTFGFCASWSLHFVGMLACKLDLAIGLDLGLTILTGILAVLFTFIAMGYDILRESFYNKGAHQMMKHFGPKSALYDEVFHVDSQPLLGARDSTDEGFGEGRDAELLSQSRSQDYPERRLDGEVPNSVGPDRVTQGLIDPPGLESAEEDGARRAQMSSVTTLVSSSRPRYSAFSRDSNFEAGYDLEGMAYQGNTPSHNAFVATYKGVVGGMTWKAVWMGLVWSFSLTCMHYGGLAAMKIPGGFLTLDPVLVAISAIISWVVCIVGYIYMVNIEAFLSQQVLFSVVAASGIASMHFTGMRATTFWSVQPPSLVRGYPIQLPVAVCSVSILTCMLANGLLLHNATLSRNKLAEIVWTRRELWRTIAQKENAEAAAAVRSRFIALASHEIRTPLHHLQGYSDLLSRTKLDDEGRQLVLSIQSATKTLSLITNNVLDWSKLESDRDALCRPTPLDIRSVFESILVLLPNRDDDVDVDIMVIIAPNVPKSLMLDESYIHRIMMNLLSNALKFTVSGYVMLTLEIQDTNLVATVRDTGAGIPLSFLPHLFDPFSQAQTQGSQRGTGLGLSIVRQLLEKMNGIIKVDSQNAEQGFGPNETGTSFTITIPVPSSDLHLSSPPPSPTDGIVAIVHPGNTRKLKGLLLAWALFGYEVIVVNSVHELSTDLSKKRVKYVWVDSSFIQRHLESMDELFNLKECTVLVPYKNQGQLKGLPGLLLTGHLVPVQKPLLWHTFDDRIDIARATGRTSSRTTLSQAMSAVSPMNELRPPPKSNDIVKNINILLVEDNKINQKLGTQMLVTLGYTVLLANDGDEAISHTVKHDTTLDMILMDQSMPTKDGVTATREIRALEATGKLSRRHPIIAVTAVVDTKSKADFKDAGADDFLAKPLSLRTLEQTLSTFFL